MPRKKTLLIYTINIIICVWLGKIMFYASFKLGHNNMWIYIIDLYVSMGQIRHPVALGLFPQSRSSFCACVRLHLLYYCPRVTGEKPPDKSPPVKVRLG